MLDVPDFNTSVEDPPAPSNRGGFVRFAVVLALAAGAVFGVRYYSGGAARIAAADRDAGVRPRLLMFTADWCGPCQNFKGTVLSDDRVVAAVVETCKFEIVDVTKWEGKPAEVAGRYGVRSIPTLILVNSRGEEFARYKGPHDPRAFAAWLGQFQK